MNKTKTILSVFIVLLAILAIAFFIGLKNLDSLVKNMIEDTGTAVTKTAVTVDDVQIDITGGRGEIRGIRVKSPEGYATRDALKLDRISLQVDPSSVSNPVIVITELAIDGAKLTAEHKGLADINLQDLYQNIAGKKNSREIAQSNPQADLRFMVEKMSFTQLSMEMISDQHGQGALSLPDIHQHNIGDKQTGLTAEELAHALLAPVIDAARKKVNSELKDKAREELQDKLKENLSDEDKQRLDSIKSLLKQ